MLEVGFVELLKWAEPHSQGSGDWTVVVFGAAFEIVAELETVVAIGTWIVQKNLCTALELAPEVPEIVHILVYH